MGSTHNGVLLPQEMTSASEKEKDEYAAKVKTGNRAFLDAYWKLEDEAARHGILFHEDASTA